MELDPETEAAERKSYKKESFAQAFDRHRKAGDKKFVWRGKEYTTELAGSKPAAPTKTGDAAKFRGPQGANLLSRQEQRYPGVRERSEDSPMARGRQGANLSPRQEQRYPGMREEAASDESGRFRSRRADDDSMRYRGERSYVAKPEEPAGPTAEQLARYEEMMRPGRDAIEGVYPEAALIPAARGAEKLARAGLGALRGAMTRKEAAKEAAKPRRSEPTMRGDESVSPGKPGRSEPYMRGDDEFAPIRSGRTEPSFKRGGAVKSHRGDGICKRGHTKGVMR